MSQVIAKAVEKFVALRDAKKAIQDRHKEELRLINEGMVAIENAVQRIMLQQGASNMKTPHGTAYLSTTTRPSITDWKELRPFILEHDLIDMMVNKLTPAAVEEFVESQGNLPPGVIMTSETNCRFKR